MKIFFDSEFMEDGKTIDPLSFGFVTEEGKKLYVAVLDADLSKANPWVQQNVLPYVYEGCSNPMWRGPSHEVYVDDETLVYAQVAGWKVGSVIQHWVEQVCPIDIERSPFPEVEFWADYASYDWVLLCQQFGRMIDKPSYWPMFVMDIQQMKREVGYTEALPEPKGQAHNALDDALNVQQRYEILTAWSEDQARDHEQMWADSDGGIEDDGTDPAGTT